MIWSPRWLILADGRILADGTPERIMSDGSVLAAAGLRPTQRFEFFQRLRETPLGKGHEDFLA
jgi:hypothetical protein